MWVLWRISTGSNIGALPRVCIEYLLHLLNSPTFGLIWRIGDYWWACKGKLILSAGLAGAAVERLKPNLLEGHNAKTGYCLTVTICPVPNNWWIKFSGLDSL